MIQYVLTSPKIDGQILFKYSLKGMLVGFEISGEITAEQLNWFCNNLPQKQEDLERLTAGKNNQAQIKRIAIDLSYEEFWERYKNKVGNKKRSRKLWDALSESERLAIFAHIPVYSNECFRKRIEKCYPETYLAQQRWDVN